MRFHMTLTLVLLAVTVTIYGKDSHCGNGAESCPYNEDLSFMETILLFPLSLDDKPMLLQKTEDTEQPGNSISSAFQYSTSLCSRLLSKAYAYVRLLADYSFGWIHFGWLPDNFVYLVSSIYDCLGAFPESLIFSTLHGCWQAMHDWAVTYMNGLCEHPSFWDFLRYLVVMVLALSVLPAMKITGKNTIPKRILVGRYAQPNRSIKDTSPPQRTYGTQITNPLRALNPPLKTATEIPPESNTKNLSYRLFLHHNTLYHYPMCEIFDQQRCNCWGKPSHVVVAENESFQNPSLETAQKFKTNKRTTCPFLQHQALYHYPMCEFFDHQPCNCGGKPSHVVIAENRSLKGRSCLPDNRSYRKQVVSYHPKIHTRGLHRESRSDTRLDLCREGPIPSAKPIIKCSDEGRGLNKDIGRQTVGEYSGRIKKTDLPTPVTASDENSDTDIETEDVFEMSLTELDIGDPRFNSSFKEESMYVINDIIDPCANGDGPDRPKAFSPTIMTRRSPVKKLGLSFDEVVEEEAGPSYLDDSFEDILGNGMGEEEPDSLLDVSHLSTSMSYSGTDGVLEFAVVFVAQTIYRWAKGFLRHRKYIRSDGKLRENPEQFDFTDDHLCNLSKNAVDNMQVDSNIRQSNNTEADIESRADTVSGADKESTYFEPLNESFLAESDITPNEDDSLQIGDDIWTDSGNDSNKENIPVVYDNEDSRRIISFSEDTSDLVDAAGNYNDNARKSPVDEIQSENQSENDGFSSDVVVDLQAVATEPSNGQYENVFKTEQAALSFGVVVDSRDVRTKQNDYQTKNIDCIINVGDDIGCIRTDADVKQSNNPTQNKDCIIKVYSDELKAEEAVGIEHGDVANIDMTAEKPHLIKSDENKFEKANTESG